jgi:hypothetical protein
MSLATTAWGTRIVRTTRALGIVTSAAAITAVTSGALFYTTNILSFPSVVQASTAPLAQIIEAEPGPNVNKPPKITKQSSYKALELAKSLKLVGAKMYGAFWCSHCFNQKQELGVQVAEGNYYQYIECDKEGFMSEYPLCRAKNVII